MIDIDLVNRAEQTWLYNLIQAAEEAEIKYLHQACETEFVNGGKATIDTPFLVIQPVLSIDELQDQIETIVLTFGIIAVSAQKPGDSLIAHRLVINQLLSVIDKALFSPDKLTMNSMDRQTYSLPLKSFSESGEPTPALGKIEYRRSVLTDDSDTTNSVRQWSMTITAYVSI